MPVDSSIALAGKPPVLPEFDVAKTFLTLGQLKYLQSETQRTEAQAALAGTQGQQAQEELAATQRLRAVPLTTPVAPGGPPFDDPTLGALAQGERTPAAPAQRRLTTEELAAQYVAADPIKGPELAKALFANDKQALETRLQHATFAANVFKDANNQAEWNTGLAYIEHVTGKTTEHLPQVFSPEAKAQMANVGRSVQQEIEQKQKDVELSIRQYEATTAAKGAATAAAAEERTGRRYTYPTTPTGILPLPEYPQPGEVPMGGGTPGGAPQPIPGTAPAMPGGAAEAAGYEQRARAAHTLSIALEDKGVNVAGGVQKAVSSVPVVGNYFTPTEVQRYNQAKSDFITAISRGESPRMSPQQLDLYDKQYFPQPGDDPTTIQQKRVSRESALQELRIQTNRPEGLTPPGQTQMPGTPPGAGSAPQASGRAPLWTPENVAELKRGLIAAGNTPAQAEAVSQQIQRATPAPAPAAQGKPSGATKEVWSQKEFTSWMQHKALGEVTPAQGLEFLRSKGIEVTP